MRLLGTIALTLTVLAGGVARAAAQLPDPPVRYDDDLLPPSFHQHRRDSLLATLPDDAVAVILGAPTRTRENDVSYEYRQSSDLYYLTGTHEAGSALLLAPAGVEVDGKRVHEVVFVPPRNPAMERWTGRRFGPERAASVLGVAAAVESGRFEGIVRAALEGRRLYHLPFPNGVPEGSTLAQQIAVLEARGNPLDLGGTPMVQYLAGRLIEVDTDGGFRAAQAYLDRIGDRIAGTPVEEMAAAFAAAGSLAEWDTWKVEHLGGLADGFTVRRALDRLRAVKTPEELRLLRRAIAITAAAHREAFTSIEPGMHEYEVEAVIEYVFHVNGAEYTGFPSIVGSGENSVVLHYESNRRRMEAGDLVVMDIGAEYHGYTADITRTVPVSGTFSAEQRTIYEIVLRAQDAAFAAVRPGASLGAVHGAAQQVIFEGLRDAGLVTQAREVSRFFPHGTSHHLGLYVHDVGGGALVEGMVFTVEPGIYIPPAEDIDPRWWNIGVRVEDDVLVTADGYEQLSDGAPRTVAEIEALMEQDGIGNLENGRVGG
ncbi:MAG: aminopeptidase P N-terminal domain-containing protein [Gemmatimonadales bacterium]|jgi:Xaa-Pro aminopeptidase